MARQQPLVSILIPTLNEAGNIEPVLSRVFSTIDANNLNAEVLIVDGGSTDETLARVNRWPANRPVRLILAGSKRGLAGDLVAAAEMARGKIIVVLDADLSHPPEAIPQLIQPLLDGVQDMAIASRYLRGGAMVAWPLRRWLVSRTATMLVSPLVDVKDPLSGFFAVRRELLLKFAGDLSGFKIGLEILVRGGERLRVTEVPIVFHNRASGKSKFGILQVGNFLLQLITLLGGKVPAGLPMRIAAITTFALILDIVLFHSLIAAQINIVASQISSFVIAAVTSFALGLGRRVVAFSRTIGISRRQFFGRWAIVCCLVLLIRNAVFLMVSAEWPAFTQAATFTGALVSAALLFAGSLAVFLEAQTSVLPRIRWQLITFITVAYCLMLKLVFMGLVNLMPEEAYYWNYAQYLDFGYLDHPPMVAWLIWLSTSLLGDSEFSVRMPAFIAWMIAAVFMFRLTANLCNRPAAFRSVLLFAVLPIYFGAGFFITPDAPLYAAWTGSLYYLERALIAGERRAWRGVGLCLGLGMLAKYTIGLLGLGTLVFMLFDRRSRWWLLRPQPYIAALLGGIIFSPVLLWNIRNGWASFTFQGANRWSGTPEFSLHFVLLSLLLVLTPIGLLAVGKLLLNRNGPAANSRRDNNLASRYLWLFSFTVVPLLVFVAHSLQDDSKLHWTGPVLLAAIPLLASDMVFRAGEIAGSLTRVVRYGWLPTVIGLLFCYGTTFYYFSLGLPGSPMSSPRAFGAWRLLTARVGQIEHVIEAKSGSEPIVVGMDKYNIASEISFYDQAGGADTMDTGAPNLLGGRGLMWAYWLPRSAALGRNLLMIDFDKKRLANPRLAQHFESISDVVHETLKKDGRVVAHFHWRVGYGLSR